MCSRSRCSSESSSDCLTALPRFSLATRPTYGDLVAKRRGEDPLLVVPVRRDEDGGVVGARLGLLGGVLLDRVAEPAAQVRQGVCDRGGTDHAEGRGGQVRLQEDLQGAAAEAGVLDGHGSILDRRLALGATWEDPQEHRVAGLQRAQRVQAHRGLGAGAADEALDGSVGTHHRGVAGPHARRALRPHDRGLYIRTQGSIGVAPSA